MRRNILAFSFFPAFLPPTNGGVERLFRLYSELSEEFEITLITSAQVGGDREVVAHSSTFTEIRIPKDNHFEDCYRDLLTGAGNGDISGPALGLACGRFGALHDEYLQHHPHADLIIHDSPFMIECDLFRGFDGKPRVYHSYNFETGLYRSFHSGDRSPEKIERLVESLERETCVSADLITACSNDDKAAFGDAFAPSAPIILAPNGFSPTAARGPSRRLPNRLVFLGSGHHPNVEAVELIRRRLAPRLPDVEFHIIGGCAPAGRKKNVIAHGFVDQKTKLDILDGATAAVNPMISGSGSSLKIADLADHGVPLLSTALGARGFDLEPGVHYLPLAIDTLEADVERALASTEKLREISASSASHFRRNFTWSKIGKDFATELQQLATTPKDPPVLVLNDYDSFAAIGGGATRTKGLCTGLSETKRVIFLTFMDDPEGEIRSVALGGRALMLRVPKSKDHLAEHLRQTDRFWVSTADLVNYRHAATNTRLHETFAAAAALSSAIICEHPYMVALPRHFRTDFVYSSQNFELELKREALADHPDRDELLSLVEEAERYACGASQFIVAVSESDARQFSGHYRFTAPILVIPNGAEGPSGEAEFQPDSNRQQNRVVFLGSAHMPNIEAATWICDVLAPKMTDVDFLIIGSVCDGLNPKPRANLELRGVVGNEEKSELLRGASLAINPMTQGSGSNVKIADFLQHGLPVVSTAFGARGYEDLPGTDVILAELDKFEQAIRGVLESETSSEQRAQRYAKSLSMEEGGRALAKLLAEHSGERNRALYVTYRYNDPPRGGGEAYVVRLVQALAGSGWAVDVVSPAADKIDDVHRFGARFTGENFQPVPVGRPRIRSGKFALDEEEPDQPALSAIWGAQPAFMAELVRNLPKPKGPALAWGWADPGPTGRWGMTQAGLYLPEEAEVSLIGRPIGKLWLQIRSEAGELLDAMNVSGPLRIERTLPAGFTELLSSIIERGEGEDVRPLAMHFSTITVNGVSILEQQFSDIWLGDLAAEQIFGAHERARIAARSPRNLRLSEHRIGSKAVVSYVEDQIRDYDLLITHNAVFGVATAAIRTAKSAGVPSLFVPHLHYDDDFYHFPDVLEACADASVTLVAPRQLTSFLQATGLRNLVDHGPGIDVETEFSEADSAAFREVLGRPDPFFLVLGRKAGAKGYTDAIDAAERSKSRPLIVMIGPDDDGEVIRSKRVIYLGARPLAVVRGALRECIGLINMSRSESFGIVLLEAGLAGKPVLANRSCVAFQDLVEDGVNGFLVGSDDLPSRIDELVGDEKLRLSLGEGGRRRAADHAWKQVEDKFVALCSGLVGQK
ncbi:MAG TPA: glycosyltransferase [Sphingomicrobium sp.]|nr:glycosyltransferase [Sphingomicrobium sp.]